VPSVSTKSDFLIVFIYLAAYKLDGEISLPWGVRFALSSLGLLAAEAWHRWTADRTFGHSAVISTLPQSAFCRKFKVNWLCDACVPIGMSTALFIGPLQGPCKPSVSSHRTP
jgi:hypothetical protein